MENRSFPHVFDVIIPGIVQIRGNVHGEIKENKKFTFVRLGKFRAFQLPSFPFLLFNCEEK